MMKRLYRIIQRHKSGGYLRRVYVSFGDRCDVTRPVVKVSCTAKQ